MATIQRILLHNFKSFRKCDLPLGGGVIEITGPNGSGKSNIVDAIRFALGETHMKSLRAKNVRELINEKATHASVTLCFDNPKAEIKRTINSEGKVVYRLNGQKVRKADVENILFTFGIDTSFYNIIPQGEVQKIVEMEPKKRRELIDALAGISEYESKKSDALRELETVENRINETNLILKEREAFLAELEKEKEAAEKYLQARDIYQRCRMTLIKTNLESCRTELEQVITRQRELQIKKETLMNEILNLEKSIKEIEKQKHDAYSNTDEISAKDSLKTSLSKIETEIRVTETLNHQLEENSESVKKSLAELENEIKNLQKSIDELELEYLEKQKHLSQLEKNINDSISSDKTTATNVWDLEKTLVELNKKIDISLEKKQQLTRIIGELIARAKALKEETTQLDASTNRESTEGMDEVEILLKRKTSVESNIKNLFEREKELNELIPEVDKKILELKESTTMMKTINKGSSLTQVVKELKEKINGIHGLVSELIEYDEKYGEAIYAGAGNRLNYLVVESIDVAKQVIEVLKRNKIGRMTFIPLKEININETVVKELSSEALGYLKDFVKVNPKYRKVMEFAFGSTILVTNLESAKLLKGKARIVTLTGELLEPNGVLSGGYQKAESINLAKLERLENELNLYLEMKKNYFLELQQIRKEMTELRRERSEIEVKIKEFEVMNKIYTRNQEENRKKSESLKNELKKIEDEIQNKETELKLLDVEIQKHDNQKKNLEKDLLAITAEKEEKLKQHKEYSHLLEEKAKTTAELEAIKHRIEILRSTLESRLKKSHELKKQSTEIESSIQKNQKILRSEDDQKIQLVKEISDLEERLNKKFSRYQELEKRYEELAALRGQKVIEKEKIENEFTKAEIRKSALQTKYSDLSAEIDYEQLKNFKILDLPKEELERMMHEAEKTITELQNTVNLKAPEIYAEKAKGVLESREKINKLAEEKDSVMRFINEVEEKKKEAFLSTFARVNENFRKLFSLLFKDSEGNLELDKPSSPFESGLHIKVVKQGKKRSLDALSGGEKSTLALLFILSMHSTKSAPFYIFDEADAALDKENCKKFGQLMRELAKTTQIIVITHNDIVLKYSDKLIGVTKNHHGESEIYGIKIEALASET